jgi:hypothetical protein
MAAYIGVVKGGAAVEQKREIGIMGGNGEDNDGLLCFLGYLFV